MQIKYAGQMILDLVREKDFWREYGNGLISPLTAIRSLNRAISSSREYVGRSDVALKFPERRKQALQFYNRAVGFMLGGISSSSVVLVTLFLTDQETRKFIAALGAGSNLIDGGYYIYRRLRKG